MKPTSPKATDAKAARSLAELRSMSSVEGGRRTVNWDALAPHIDHPTRRRIVEALETAGEPLSERELYGRFVEGGPRIAYLCLSYHVLTLVTYGILDEVGERVTTRGNHPVFYFPSAT